MTDIFWSARLWWLAVEVGGRDVVDELKGVFCGKVGDVVPSQPAAED